MKRLVSEKEKAEAALAAAPDKKPLVNVKMLFPSSLTTVFTADLRPYFIILLTSTTLG